MDAPPQGPLHQRHSGLVYSSVESRNPWQTGYLRRLPIIGLLSVLGAITGIAACAGVLVYSDGKLVAQWQFQPTVYLAIAATITNICLAVALSEGADIAWWRKASQDNTTVADLHRLWTHGKGFKDAVTSGRNMSLVAVACIFATIAQINSPLLQRASTVTISSVNTTTQVSFRATESLPVGYTGYISGRERAATLLKKHYIPIVLAWNNNLAISANGTGCNGMCYTRIKALGLSLNRDNCTRSRTPFNLTASLSSNGASLNLSAQSTQGIDIFRSNFTYSPIGGDYFNLTVVYKETENCFGDLITDVCAMEYVIVEYPVVINGNKSTIALDPRSTILDDKIVGTQLGASIREASTLSGFYLSLKNRYNSVASMRFTGAVGPWTLLTTGNTALQYVVVNDEATPHSNCSTSFKSPMEDILASARDLLFRTSIAAATFETPIQKLNAMDVQDRPVYRSNYYYLGGAIAVTITATFATLCIFRGYSEFGRSPTMSPIEVAKAFNAPLLQSNDGNAEAEDLVREVGHRNVRYGAVQDEFGAGAEVSHPDVVNTEYKPYDPYVQEVNTRRRLVMGPPDQVRMPESGETFSG